MNLPTTVPQQSRGARIALAALAVLIAFMCTFSVPATALALDTSKTTAKTNSDSGADVLGGKETRVTWEGQAAEGEELSGLSLTFPAGTQFGVDDARVTLLKDGGSERVAVLKNAKITKEGQTIKATFDVSSYKGAGDFYRLEVYEVVFPVSGGDQQLTGTYTLA